MTAAATGPAVRAGTTGATTHRAGFWQSPSVRRRCVDVAAVGALLTVGVLAWGPVFGGHVGYTAAGGGVLLGVLIALVAAWRAWTRLGTLLATVLTYLAAGGALALPSTTVAGVLPTIETIQRLTLLSWQSWRDLLTVAVPAGEFDGPAVLPFLVAIATATVSTSAALRLRRIVAVVPVVLVSSLVLLVLGILWGAHSAPLSAFQGGLFAAVALGWASWRSQLGEPGANAIFRTAGARPAPRMRQAVSAGAALAIAAGIGGVAWGLIAPDPNRQVLRDDIDPPLDLHAYPSPLTGYRYLELKLEKETLLTVDGLPEGARIRLAAMDMYDGDVYNVTEESAAFSPTGRTIAPGEFSDSAAEVAHLSIDVGAYEGIWLPGGGDLRRAEFDDESVARGLFYNAATGTALTTEGVDEGDQYELDVALAPTYDDDAKADLPEDIAPDTEFRMPLDTARVEEVSSALGALRGDASTPLDQLLAVEAGLRRGYYANGTEDNPSFAGHTARRIGLLLDPENGQMVGDDEQYAVAMALMARELGLPARVVMGLYPDPERGSSGDAIALTGDDAHVWVEVLFSGIGWVNFDPTPDEDRIPDQNEPKPEPKREPQVLPPPEVPEDKDLQPPPRKDSDEDRAEDPGTGLIALALIVAAIAAGAVAVVFGPFVVIAALKRRRRERRRNARRPADRVSGGWSELVDMVTDLGLRVPADATRYETAVLAVERVPATTSIPIAHQADAHVFGATDPTEGDAAAVWDAIDRARLEFRRTASFRDRFRTRFGMRSLVRRPSRPSGVGSSPEVSTR